MTDTPNEQAPATRSEWLALIREAVRLEMGDHTVRPLPIRAAFDAMREAEVRLIRPIIAPQPPSEG